MHTQQDLIPPLPYAPDDAEDAASFETTWCSRCVHYVVPKSMTAKDCELGIIDRAFRAGSPLSADHPREWYSNGDGEGRCSAFALPLKPQVVQTVRLCGGAASAEQELARYRAALSEV